MIKKDKEDVKFDKKYYTINYFHSIKTFSFLRNETWEILTIVWESTTAAMKIPT